MGNKQEFSNSLIILIMIIITDKKKWFFHIYPRRTAVLRLTLSRRQLSDIFETI